LKKSELCFEERLGIASQLRETLGWVNEHALLGGSHYPLQEE